MSVICDGSRVAYVGLSGAGEPGAGDQGSVLSGTSAYAHVLWRTGTRTGRVDMVHLADLVAVDTPVPGLLDDSLDAPVPHAVQARRAMDEGGPAALVAYLEDAGALSPLEDSAQRATAVVAARVRADPRVAAVLAEFEPEDAAGLVDLLCRRLLGYATAG